MIDIGLFVNINLIIVTISDYQVNIALNVKIIMQHLNYLIVKK